MSLLDGYKAITEKQHLQHILATYFVQITVGQSSDISTGFSRKNIQINWLSKYIVLSCGIRRRMKDMSININVLNLAQICSHENTSHFSRECFCSPNIATTTRPLRISIDPLEMKYRAEIWSPACTRVSPGGAWVVLNLMASALRQPLVDP